MIQLGEVIRVEGKQTGKFVLVGKWTCGQLTAGYHIGTDSQLSTSSA